VAGLSAIGSSGYGTLTPALAELGAVYGVSNVAVGLLQGVVAVPGIALAPVIGRLADLLGRGRVALFCLLLFVVTGTACVFVGSFELALALRALQGLGFVGLLTIPPTVIGDRTDGHRRRRAVAVNSMILTSASTLGPVIGGLLASTSDPRNTFWIYLLGLALVPSTIRVLGLAGGTRTGQSGSFRQVRAELRERSAGTGVAGALLLTLGTIVLVSALTSAMLPLTLLHEYDVSVATRGVFIGLANVGSVAASATLVVIAGRLGDRSGALLGLALMCVALLALSVAPTLWLIALLVLVFGFGVGTTYNSALHQISRQEVAGRGLLIGAWSASGRGGQFLGPIAGAALVTSMGPLPANAVAGACCAAALAGVLLVTRALARRSAGQAVQPQRVAAEDGLG
jgi:ACDE family multidrug resistance protein